MTLRRIIQIMKKLQKQLPVLKFLLIAILLVQSGINGYLLTQLQSTNKKLESYKNESTALNSIIAGNLSMQRPTVLPREKLIAITELDIALPLNDLTKTMRYSTTNGEDYYFGSTDVQDSKMRQLSCTELVRINTNSDQQYNPWEEPTVTVNLANGKSIHVFAMKAFANDEASTLECGHEVWNIITPQMFVEEFQKAQPL